MGREGLNEVQAVYVHDHSAADNRLYRDASSGTVEWCNNDRADPCRVRLRDADDSSNSTRKFVLDHAAGERTSHFGNLLSGAAPCLPVLCDRTSRRVAVL